MKTLLTAALATASIATPALAASGQFNLICEGKSERCQNGVCTPRAASEVDRLVLSIDLVGGLWFNHRADKADPITRIEPDKLIFDEKFVRQSVSRTTGVWSRSMDITSPTDVIITVGICRVAPFEGMPQQLF